MTKKTKLNYAVMRSGFGNLWIGGTYLEPNGKSIFAAFDDALEQARSLNDSIENANELDDTTEEDVKLIGDDMGRWIISS